MGSTDKTFACCGGNDETPQEHCRDCPALLEEVAYAYESDPADFWRSLPPRMGKLLGDTAPQLETLKGKHAEARKALLHVVEYARTCHSYGIMGQLNDIVVRLFPEETRPNG